MSKELSMEIMSPGTWNGFKFPKERLQKIVDNFKSLMEVHKVPLKIGHAENQLESETSSNDQHALGWADDVWLTAAGKMMAKFVDVPDVVHKAVTSKLYKKVSVELDFDVPYKGNNIGDVLSGVALLGADIPAVNTIEDLQAFLSANSGTVAGTGKACFTTIQTNYEPKKEVIDMSGENTKLDELVRTIADMQATIASLQADKTKLELEKANLESDKAKFEREEEERKEKEEKAAIKLARESVNKIFDEGVKTKAITPAQREQFSKLLCVDDDEAVTKIDLELVGNMVGKGSANFSTKPTAKGSTMDDEKKTDETPDAELSRKAHELVNSGAVSSFKLARQQVMRTDPKLAEAYIHYNDTLED